LTVLPPGKVQCPFNNHHGEEEMFLIIEGEGELRFNAKRHPIRKHDVISCPPGGREVAHQIINTGTATMRCLALSNLSEVDACRSCSSSQVNVATMDCGRLSARSIRSTITTANLADGSLEGQENTR
jgi:uncharacterized cupin superfamily protein